MNFWDIFILIIVGIILALAFWQATKRSKNGGCGCGCAECQHKCNEQNTKLVERSVD